MRSAMWLISVGFTPAGRLVEKDDRRVGHEHVGELKQLALAVGERACEDVRVPLDADELEQFQRAPPVVRPGVPAEPGQQVLRLVLGLRRDQHVLEHGEPGEDPRELEGPADASGEHLVGGEVGDRLVAEPDLARVRARW